MTADGVIAAGASADDDRTELGEPLSRGCRVTAWRPPVDGISEVFHARFVDHGYPPHHHDTWTVLIVDSGAISYALDRRECGAFGDTVAILPPGVTHDGKPASGAGGFTKRVLYLDREVLPERLVGPADGRWSSFTTSWFVVRTSWWPTGRWL